MTVLLFGSRNQNRALPSSIRQEISSLTSKLEQTIKNAETENTRPYALSRLTARNDTCLKNIIEILNEILKAKSPEKIALLSGQLETTKDAFLLQHSRRLTSQLTGIIEKIREAFPQAKNAELGTDEGDDFITECNKFEAEQEEKLRQQAGDDDVATPTATP